MILPLNLVNFYLYHYRECTDLNKVLADKENEYLQKLRKQKIEKIQQDQEIENNKELEAINNIRSKIQQRLKEKGAIASNLTTDFDRIIKKLDTDLLDFESELKIAGL